MLSLKKTFTAMTLSAVLIGGGAVAGDYDGKKVLFIDSYHEGYPWSYGITAGVQQTLYGSGVELKIIRMDTKRNKEGEVVINLKMAEAAGLEAPFELIESATTVMK